MRYVGSAMHARTLGLLAISLLLVAAAPAPSPDAQAAFDRGERALAEGRTDQAVAAYKEAISKSPGYAAALNGLGLALFKQDKKPEAIQQALCDLGIRIDAQRELYCRWAPNRSPVVSRQQPSLVLGPAV